jgi:peptidoglycan/xylan/chitin deacetylase (PgdA/CDA1 family)
MLVAGIAWTATGFEVAVVDDTGAPRGLPVRIPAGQVGALTEHLLALEGSGRDSLVCVIDSTNGMVDGGLMAAGLHVHRADPWVLPPRPRFGSVPAPALAEAGASRLAELPHLVIDGGTLTGRGDEHDRFLRASEGATARLMTAGRCIVRAADGGLPDPAPIALTFDDGPRPPHTGRVLDVLDRYGVPATFFCVGLHAQAHTEQLDRMAEAGHRIGNHTWSHPFLPDLSPAELAVQLDRTDEAIARADGSGRRLFRPPYGSRTPEILDWFARDSASTMVLWDVDTGDWAMPGADTIAQRVLDQAGPGSIVLMHDGGGDRSQTAEALPAIIEGLLERGHRFATVDALLGDAVGEGRGLTQS